MDDVAEQPLRSWREGATRDAVLEFVAAVTEGPEAVPPEQRVAVFDNDGTLWSEKPMPTQLHFIVDQWRAALREDPGLAEQQPYRAVATGDLAWIGGAVDHHYAGDDTDLRTMLAAILATTSGMSVEEYESAVAEFYAEAQHPTLNRPYASTIYLPMLELLRLLDDAGFTSYIVSGGDRDFMRPMTMESYGIPPERVIGSAVGLEYDDAAREVRYGASLSFFDDGLEKPVRIWTRVGRRPLLAAGNSNGDGPMLRFVQGHPRSLSLLVHHDDDTGRGDQPYDRGAEVVLGESREHGFQVVSVKHDWATVFPP
jgi:phosphoserine phosphatase